MPDEEGYLLPGELGGGGYAAMEGDLGHKLRPLAGFGRDFEEVEEEFWPGVIFTPESHQTSPGTIVYEIKFPD